MLWYCYHIQTHLNLSSVLRHNLPSRVGVGYVLQYGDRLSDLSITSLLHLYFSYRCFRYAVPWLPGHQLRETLSPPINSPYWNTLDLLSFTQQTGATGAWTVYAISRFETGKDKAPQCKCVSIWWMRMDSNHQRFLCHRFTVCCLQPFGYASILVRAPRIELGFAG